MLEYLKKQGWYSYAAFFFIGMVLSSFAMFNYSSSSFKEEKAKIKAYYEKQYQLQEKFYESKTEKLQKELNKISVEKVTTEKNYQSQVKSLSKELTSLKKKTFTETIEIHYPDGKWEKRKVSRTTVKELSQKIKEESDKVSKKYKQDIAEIEKRHEQETYTLTSKYKLILDEQEKRIQTYKEQIKTLEQNTHTLNQKQNAFGVGFGITTDMAYRVHTDYMFLGPIYMGVDLDESKDTLKSSAAFSLGVRF